MKRCQLPEILLLDPLIHADARGHFFESWNEDRFARLGMTAPSVQDNVSRSVRDVVRGLHFQHPHDQAKLVTVLSGAVFDVAVDIRADSPRFGRWMGVELSDAKPRQLYLPAGFAHGVVALTAEAIISYKCTAYYAPGTRYQFSGMTLISVSSARRCRPCCPTRIARVLVCATSRPIDFR